MDKFERIFQLHRILANRRTVISRADLEARLDCSRATLTRLIGLCRDYFRSPIAFDPQRQGYYLNLKEGESFELPGLWFNSSEIHALLTTHRLLSDLGPGLLEAHIAPLRQRLESLLKHPHASHSAVFERIRILPMGTRESGLENFQKIADALLVRKRLRIQYRSRGKDELSERWISPQRLVYYRDNWYLDAWCHMREAIRTFSLDAMNVAEANGEALDLPNLQLDAHLTQSYGIFAGPATQQAVLHFSPIAARWVADEQWHPRQQGRVLPDGAWELLVPYGDPTELLRDILRYGPEVEVKSPDTLRELVAENLSQALGKYKKLGKT